MSKAKLKPTNGTVYCVGGVADIYVNKQDAEVVVIKILRGEIHTKIKSLSVQAAIFCLLNNNFLEHAVDLFNRELEPCDRIGFYETQLR